MFLKKIQNKKGFTLLEIIVSVAIIIFLSATMFQIINVSDTQQSLLMNSDKIKAGIRLAQTYSLAIPHEISHAHVCGFGVHIAGSRAVVYYLHNPNFATNPLACDNTGNLNYGSSLSRVIELEIDLGSEYTITGPELFFTSPYSKIISNGGYLSGEVPFTITQTRNGNTQSKNVRINSSGKISI